ncbi:MAG: DNA polymerase III subunit gamma/tau, partial [Muribaculaceae bacterium]|nr:DNA polymerase III subunit gamma/tau [Muribaculaceae bacterium]
VHMLSSSAFNAFLKTLEEPPSYVIFILATTEKHKVLPTILSRCQTYDFRRITIEDMVEQMQRIGEEEGIKTDRRGLEVIARKADGAMRDALSIFDQVAASSRGNITYESAIENLNVLDYEYYFRLIDAFREGDIQQALLIYRDVRIKGFDSLFFLNGLADHVRNLMVAADPRTADLIETSKDVAERYTRQAKTLPLQWYYAGMKILNDGDVQYRTASNKQFLTELVLIRLCQLMKPATPPFDLVDCEIPLGDILPKATPAAKREATLPQSTEEGTRNVATARPQAPADTEPRPLNVDGGRRVVRRKSGSSFRLTDSAVDDRMAQYEARRQQLREPVTIERFMEAWAAFQYAHPDQHILCSAMRGCTPTQTGPEEFLALLAHPAEYQAFELAMTPLMEFLRKELRNDFLVLKTAIDPDKAAVKQLPPQEFLKQSIELNPDLGTLLDAIDGELA